MLHLGNFQKTLFSNFLFLCLGAPSGFRSARCRLFRVVTLTMSRNKFIITKRVMSKCSTLESCELGLFATLLLFEHLEHFCWGLRTIWTNFWRPGENREIRSKNTDCFEFESVHRDTICCMIYSQFFYHKSNFPMFKDIEVIFFQSDGFLPC